MTITYSTESNLSPEEFINVLERSTLAERRPVDDLPRIENMLKNAQCIATARNEHGLLVGVARAITDFVYCTYLSDLAVDEDYQGQKIGRTLIDNVHAECGIATTLILIAAPKAETYYPHVGLQQHRSCWIKRQS